MAQVYVLLAIGGIDAIGYASYFAAIILRENAAFAGKIGKAAVDGVKSANARRQIERAELEEANRKAVVAERMAALEAFRQQHPARILGVPNAEAFEERSASRAICLDLLRLIAVLQLAKI